MDVFIFFIILAVLLIILYPVAKYVWEVSREPESSEYQYGPLAKAKKAEVEARQRILREKETLEQNWRFGPRMYAFMSAFPDPGVRGAEFTQVQLPNPSERAEEMEGALQYVFETEEGPRRLVLFDSRFAPGWLRKIDENAFFKVVQVLDSEGEALYHARVKFFSDAEGDRQTGTLLQGMELGSWTKAIRQILTTFEKEGPEPFCKKPNEEPPAETADDSHQEAGAVCSTESVESAPARMESPHDFDREGPIEQEPE